MKPRLFVLLPLLTLCWNAWAEGESYRVEIIVFTQPDALPEIENISAPLPPIDTTEAVDFRKYFCQPADESALQTQKLISEQKVAACLKGYLNLNELSESMIRERLNLEKTGTYQILRHAAWQQPALDPQQTRPVRLTSARDVAANTPLLDGTVRLSKKQFLQLDIELAYQTGPSSTPDDHSEPEPTHGIILRALRKLRPGNLNYIDHPLLGILARVSLIEEEEKNAEGG